MPFREKVKRALGGSSPSTTQDSEYPPRRKDIEYYKPDKIPPSKYRGPWDQEHQDMLHAFSFSAATHEHRGSHQSICSPRGILAQSRRSSWVEREQAETEDDSTESNEDGHASSISRPVEGLRGDSKPRRNGMALSEQNSGQADLAQLT